MGYYINPDNEPKGKAQKMVDMYGAEILSETPASYQDIPVDKVVICVLDNDGIFEAAGVCVDEDEFNRFKAPDVLNQGDKVDPDTGTKVFDLNPYQQRPRTWVLMDKTKAYELSGYRGK